MSADRVLVPSPRAKPDCGGHLPSFRFSLPDGFAFCVACWQVIVASQLGRERCSGQDSTGSERVHEPPQ
jgi:hypothetical protein